MSGADCYDRTSTDQIRINDLLLIVSLLSGAQWLKSTPVEQPILISLSIFYDKISQAAQTDDLSLSLDYSIIPKRLRHTIANKNFHNLRDVSRQVTETLASEIGRDHDGLEVYVRVVQMRPPLHTKTVGIEHRAVVLRDGASIVKEVRSFVEDLVCPAIIGVNPPERIEKQDVVVNFSVDMGEKGLDDNSQDLRILIKILYEKIASSTFQTLEALTSYIAFEALSFMSCPSVSVRAAKPSALSLAGSAEIQLVRTLEDFRVGIAEPSHQISQSLPEKTPPQTGGMHTAVIALGSNLGDKFRNIEYALRLLEDPQEFSDGSHQIVNVVDTSFLYETSPMYVEDQPSFVNCACIIETTIPPPSLLQFLKSIEQKVGRLPSIRNGPRAIDLDIIFYDDQIVDAEDAEGRKLIVPHLRLQEREFVLRPLNDMIPDYVHPILKKPVRTLLNELSNSQRFPLKKLLPFPKPVHSTTITTSPPETDHHLSYDSTLTLKKPNKTHLMATVNMTPDSFSDDGTHDNLQAALSYISRSVAAGATIVDIGGYSTRPGAAFVSVDDEIERVVPVIKALRNHKETLMDVVKQSDIIGTEEESVLERHIEMMMNIPISIDTFRWEVAEAAIQAGANCINDVYAFTGPHPWSSPITSSRTKVMNEYTVNMKSIARKYCVPVVLMHSRGEAGLNKDYSSFRYAADGAVLEGVRVELGCKVDHVVRGKGGLRRWLVVVDPGIGFSKTVEGNLELLRGSRSVVADVDVGRGPLYKNPLRGFPILIGTSKKSFLGEILAREPVPRKSKPRDRAFATAAAVSSAVRQNAMIVRVHDVQEMMDVVKVTEALL